MNLPAAAEPLVVCPACRSSLSAVSATQLACSGCERRYAVDDGIPNLLAPQTGTENASTSRSAVEAAAIAHFEGKYVENEEPWEYNSRAGEILRHDYTRELAARLKPSYERILDLGCSLGQLTGRLNGLAPEIHGIDVSPVAVAKARRHCLRVAEQAGGQGGSGTTSEYHFYVGSAVDVPVPDASCDLILVCDGLRSWQLEAAQRETILQRVNRALKPGGYVILTDYLKEPLFDTFLGWVRDSPLEVSYVEYLPDRQWYQFASWFKAVRDVAPVRRLLASRRVARTIMAGSRRLGRRGAAHLCVVATRGAGPDGT
jgi:SAM-dependent methyltransferase